MLTAAEERERKLVGAEESLARRRKEAEREHKAALADAQASVRRLQARHLPLPATFCFLTQDRILHI